MHLVVIGGGITGLAAAHRAVELGVERITLLEAGPRLGGAIRTERRDGFVLEDGPESFITDKPWGIDLARRLGLEGELIGTQEANRRSFVVRHSRLLPVPEGFQLLAPSKFGPLARTPIFSWPGKMRMALDLVLPRRTDPSDESLGAFVLRRLGREALERLAEPMIGGIYGADPMLLSLQATLPRFRDMEQEHGSVIKAMWRRRRSNGRAAQGTHSGVSGARYGLFVSFRQGMETLTEALAKRVPDARLNAPVERLERARAGWAVHTPGEVVAADAVVVALPTHRAGPLVSGVDRELAELLSGVPYADAGTMNLCYAHEDVPHPLNGFGFVVPSVERLNILGCTFSHVKWLGRAPKGLALLRAFLGERGIQQRSEAELLDLVREDFRKLLGITAEPRFVRSWIGRKVMPQYRVGHLERVAEMDRRAALLPGFALAGNGYRGVGIPDSIHSGERAVELLSGQAEGETG